MRRSLWSLRLDIAYRSGEVDFEVCIEDADTLTTRFGLHHKKAEHNGVVRDLDDVPLRESREVPKSLLETGTVL